jgi:glucose-1-phosphate adenylyltransferase
MVSEGCRIYGRVIGSVLSGGVIVEPGATVRNSVIMENTRICADATVDSSIVDANTVINRGIIIGRMSAGPDGITVIPSGVTVSENVV